MSLMPEHIEYMKRKGMIRNNLPIGKGKYVKITVDIESMKLYDSEHGPVIEEILKNISKRS